MGPDLACMEWLMNAGATSIKLSNGMVIKTQAEMRQFLADQGYDTKNLKTASLPDNFNGFEFFFGYFRKPQKHKLSRILPPSGSWMPNFIVTLLTNKDGRIYRQSI
jgi:hypothetical protein